LKKTNGTIS